MQLLMVAALSVALFLGALPRLSAAEPTAGAMIQMRAARDLSLEAGGGGSAEDMKDAGIAAFQGIGAGSGAGVSAPVAIGAAKAREKALAEGKNQPKKGAKGEVPAPEAGKPAAPKSVPPWLVYAGSAGLGSLQGLLTGSLMVAAAGGVVGLAAAYFSLKGDYGAAFGLAAGSIIGSFLGGPIGAIAGAVVGGVIGHFIGKLF